MAKKTNAELSNAKNNKADEFYTMYEDIANEMSFYGDYFNGKTVYCPCDGKESNFYIYFRDNFNRLKLNKLIATEYVPGSNGRMNVYTKDEELNDILMSDDGSFLSDESIHILEETDVVVTNPPFSKLRVFMSLLTEHNMKFIIIGNINAVTYKEVFDHIVAKEIKIGPSIRAGDRKFAVPDDYELTGTACSVDDKGNKFIRVKGVRWFTNVPFFGFEVNHTTAVEGLNLKYWEKFDTYPAINTDSIKKVPYNYYEPIATTVAVMDKMNENGIVEFINDKGEICLYDIIGQLNAGNGKNHDFAKPIIKGKCKYKRILIQRLKPVAEQEYFNMEENTDKKNKNVLKVFTAFSGYDSQCLALDRLKENYPDFDYELVGWSEVDEFAIKSHNALFPQYADRNYGDISQIDWDKVPDFDLFTYSSPCQDFSFSGKQKGGEVGSGTRSSLLWECQRAIEAKKPKFCLLENVKALVSDKFYHLFKRWKDTVDDMGYRSTWAVVNATDFNIPQGRERVFMVSIMKDETDDGRYDFPVPMKRTRNIEDFLEQSVDEIYYTDDRDVPKYFDLLNHTGDEFDDATKTEHIFQDRETTRRYYAMRD